MNDGLALIVMSEDRKLRIDVFGLKPDGSTRPEGLIAPLRPTLPTLIPGNVYLVEVVVRMPSWNVMPSAPPWVAIPAYVSPVMPPTSAL